MDPGPWHSPVASPSPSIFEHRRLHEPRPRRQVARDQRLPSNLVNPDPFAAPVIAPPAPPAPPALRVPRARPPSWWLRVGAGVAVALALAVGGCSVLVWRFHHPPPYLSSLRRDAAVRLVPAGPHQILRADVTEYRRNFFSPRHAAVVELAGTNDSRTAVAAFFRTRLSQQGWSDRGSPGDVDTPSGLPRYIQFLKGGRVLTLDFLDPGFFDPRDDVPPTLRAAWPTVYRLELT